MNEVASQVFHEGRHAEQRFTIARLIAGQKPHASPADNEIDESAAAITAAASEAAATFRAMSPEDQTIVAARWQAYYELATERDAYAAQKQLAAAAITDAANHASAVFHALSPADQQAASARWQELRQQAIAGLEPYFHLATERDAFAAQKQLGAADK